MGGGQSGKIRSMMSGYVANWPRSLGIGMGLFASLGLGLIVSTIGLAAWFLTAVYPDAQHVASKTSSNGIVQPFGGTYRWNAATVTYFESRDTPDKIIKWYNPRYRIKTVHLGPLTILLITNEVHYSPPILYRTSTEIEIELDTRP
jgi:hypothetical protein